MSPALGISKVSKWYWVDREYVLMLDLAVCFPNRDSLENVLPAKMMMSSF